MKVEDAVSHIINSLDNADANVWHDDATDETWVVDGSHSHIFIEITDADDNETTYMFRLVKE